VPSRSINLLFTLHLIIIAHYDNTLFQIPAGALIRMTLNDLESPIQLKVRFTDGTLDVRMLWLSELAMRD